MPGGVWVRGTTTPVFGTQRPNDPAGVIIDVARFLPQPQTVGTAPLYTMPGVTVNTETRFWCTATVQVLVTDAGGYGAFAPSLIVGDGVQTLDGQDEWSAPTSAPDATGGKIYTYHATFDYTSEIAAPVFSFDSPSSYDLEINVTLVVIRGIPGTSFVEP